LGEVLVGGQVKQVETTKPARRPEDGFGLTKLYFVNRRFTFLGLLSCAWRIRLCRTGLFKLRPEGLSVTIPCPVALLFFSRLTSPMTTSTSIARTMMILIMMTTPPPAIIETMGSGSY
jgi:hypothetical protein